MPSSPAAASKARASDDGTWEFKGYDQGVGSRRWLRLGADSTSWTLGTRSKYVLCSIFCSRKPIADDECNLARPGHWRNTLQSFDRFCPIPQTCNAVEIVRRLFQRHRSIHLDDHAQSSFDLLTVQNAPSSPAFFLLNLSTIIPLSRHLRRIRWTCSQRLCMGWSLADMLTFERPLVWHALDMGNTLVFNQIVKSLPRPCANFQGSV